MELHPYIRWALEAQDAEGPEYWRRGPDVHKSHSEILDRVGHDKTANLDRVKAQARRDFEALHGPIGGTK